MSKPAHWCSLEKAFVLRYLCAGKLSALENLPNQRRRVEDNLFNYLRLCFWVCFWVWSALSLLIPPKSLLLLTMRGKQEGRREGGALGGLTKSSWGLEGKPHNPNSCFHSSGVKQQLRSGETDSNYSFLYPSISPSLSLSELSHSTGNHEKGATPPSPPPPSSPLRKRRLPLPARGEVMIVYFEWCAIMTLQQINVTHVCGKRWNFRVIPCKLLILSRRKLQHRKRAERLQHAPTWQLVLLSQNVWQAAPLQIC